MADLRPLDITNVQPMRQDGPVKDPRRLKAVRDLALVPTQRERLDHICELTRELLEVPVVHLNVVDEEEQRYLAHSRGFHPPPGHEEASPLEYSFCRYVVDTGHEQVVSDARQDPVLCVAPSVTLWNVRAYLGEPICDLAGNTLGSFCALDYVPRTWTEQDRFVLRHMTTLATAVLLEG